MSLSDVVAIDHGQAAGLIAYLTPFGWIRLGPIHLARLHVHAAEVSVIP